jgi:hypothetical protein
MFGLPREEAPELLTASGLFYLLQLLRIAALVYDLSRLGIVCDRCERLSPVQGHRSANAGDKSSTRHSVRRLVTALAFPHWFRSFGDAEKKQSFKLAIRPIQIRSRWLHNPAILISLFDAVKLCKTFKLWKPWLSLRKSNAVFEIPNSKLQSAPRLFGRSEGGSSGSPLRLVV